MILLTALDSFVSLAPFAVKNEEAACENDARISKVT